MQMIHSATARKIVNRLILKTQNGTMGQSDPDADKILDEDMKVRIGDEIHNHPAAVAAPAAIAKKVALATALLAAGGGVGAGIPWLAGAFDKPAASAAPMQDIDKNWEIRIESEHVK